MPKSPAEHPETEDLSNALTPAPPTKAEAWQFDKKQPDGGGNDMSWKAAIREAIGESPSGSKNHHPPSTTFPPPTGIHSSSHASAAASCGSILARAGTYYRAPLSDLQLRAPIDQLYRQSGSHETMGNWVMRVPRPGDVAGCLRTDGTSR